MPYSFTCSGCGERLTDADWDSSASKCVYCSGAHAKSRSPRLKAFVSPKPETEQSDSPCPRCGAAMVPTEREGGGFRDAAMTLLCPACG